MTKSTVIIARQMCHKGAYKRYVIYKIRIQNQWLLDT